MPPLAPRDADWERRVRASFARQSFMRLLGAEIAHLSPGACDLALRRRDDLLQQHGHFHAGVTSSIADSAAGYAALTLFPPGTGVLTTEFKINLLAAGRGERLLARGRVVRSGRTLTISRADVFADDEDGEVHLATGLFTLMALAGLED